MTETGQLVDKVVQQLTHSSRDHCVCSTSALSCFTYHHTSLQWLQQQSQMQHETHRFILLSILFSFFYHALDFLFTQTVHVISNGDVFLLACKSTSLSVTPCWRGHRGAKCGTMYASHWQHGPAHIGNRTAQHSTAQQSAPSWNKETKHRPI